MKQLLFRLSVCLFSIFLGIALVGCQNAEQPLSYIETVETVVVTRVNEETPSEQVSVSAKTSAQNTTYVTDMTDRKTVNSEKTTRMKTSKLSTATTRPTRTYPSRTTGTIPPAPTFTTRTVSGKFDKTFVFLGSSVTYGASANGWSMCEYLTEYHGCTVIKWAVSGTTLVDNGANSYVQRLLRSVNTQDVCDHFVCQLSTNDATLGKPLGKISSSFDKKDFDTSTIIGAMEFIIATAKERWNCPVSFYTGTVYSSHSYQKMVDAVLQLKGKWGIGVLDLWNDAEMNSVSSVDYNRYMADPIHPNRLGYEKWWGPKFAVYLLK